ncbi:vacuolar sorting protein 39 domain 2-domain-containing protein [Daedaleopsis nitida]|nr:vacuolar sorting protein 39 domain 2-domain-containing protein [Daedaleopsis nitida]
MGPFNSPEIVVDGFKERAESLAVQGDKLYIGTSTGNLHVYALGETADHPAELLETKKSLCRRIIEQMAYIKDVNSLAVMSEAQLTLFPYPTFSPPTPLVKAKGALCFALHTGVEYLDAEAVSIPGTPGPGKGKGLPAVVTRLAVGCKRKIVLYSWKDGEPQDVQEIVNLAHSPRAITFMNGETLCWGHTPTDYCLTSLKTSATVDVITPVPTTTSLGSGMGMGALSGLGGYMTLGLGAKAKPNVIHVSENEALIAKDNNGYMVGNDGKTSRSDSIDWPAPPEEIALVKPYVFAILPPGTVPTSQIESVPGSSASNFVPSPVIEVRSSISLSPVQTIPFPPSPLTAFATSATHAIRLLSPSPSEKSPLFVVSTPIDRTAATTSGSAIWSFRIKPWNQQIDELVEAGAYSDALSLLESLDAALIADKERKQHQIRALQAVDQFRNAKYDDAINAFIELDINPAKVVALYPESISGRLAVPQDEWIPLFGGPRPPKVEQPPTPPTASSTDLTGDPTEQEGTPRSIEAPIRAPTPQGSLRGVLLRTGLEGLVSSTVRDDDAASIRSVRRPPKRDNFHRSIETLMRYLSDRRPKIAGALATFHITPLQSHEMPHLSATSKEDLLALPSARLSSLTPEELVRFAQIVDTALFKSYLLNRPGLLASLCRVGWCEVSEVEELLREREKYQEMIYLYGGRKMHGKALDLLRQLSEHEADPRDKLMPTVNYLQRLGPEHMDQIFEHSKWVFEHDRDIAFEIFTSEEAELPKEPVADFLEKLDPALCARYIEFLISERGETSQQFHDRLAELYLRMTVAAKRRGDDVARRRTYEKLLQFINTTEHYSADRLFAMLPSEDLFEAKAILLGRLGRHDSALEVYVYRLQDFLKAEEYCKRVYQPHSPTGDVFLTLLRIYLLPGPAAPPAGEMLPPALELISRHSPRLDPVATLQLLPPLVTAEDVRAFLLEALRAPVFDTRVVRNLYKAREEQVARRLMVLQSKRVRIAESRICPQCHKRLGGSVIAVHAPHGEVTHYQCREAFSRKLKETLT